MDSGLVSSSLRILPRVQCHRIAVVNGKGGCGKTTVSTNLASYYANAGKKTALIDHDPQGSSSHWLHLRPSHLKNIYGISGDHKVRGGFTRSWSMRVPREVERVIVDTPAGTHGHDLFDRVREANTIIVPILPSPIDIHAVTQFIKELQMTGCFNDEQRRLLVVANRVKRNTTMFRQLNSYLNQQNLGKIVCIRDTQLYVQTQGKGYGIADLPESRAEADKICWRLLAKAIDAQLDQPNSQPASLDYSAR